MKNKPSTENITKIFTGKALLIWIIYAIFSLLLIAVELIIKNGDFSFSNTVWQSVIIPFAADVYANLFNLFISQVSTTFLVTSFLSLLADKEVPVYWTTAMEYKLIHPKGTSLRDIAHYCMVTLAVAFAAVFCRAGIAFLFSFTLNILFLVIITTRMISAFFNKDKIKAQLKQDFKNASSNDKKEMLRELGDNIIRASKDCNVGYLRDSVHFLTETDDSEAFRVLLQIYPVIPTELEKIKTTAFDSIIEKTKNALGESITDETPENSADISNPNYLSNKIKKTKENTKKLPTKHLDELYTNIVLEGILNILRYDIDDNQLPEAKRARLRFILDSITLNMLEELFLSLEKEKSKAKELLEKDKIDMSTYLKPYVALLEKAYDCHRDTSTYIYTVRDLYHDIICALSTIYDVIYYSNVYSGETSTVEIEPSELAISKLYCFDKADAYTIFRAICNNPIIANAKSGTVSFAGMFIVDVYNTSDLKKKEKDKSERWKDIVYGSTLLSEETLKYIHDVINQDNTIMI